MAKKNRGYSQTSSKARVSRSVLQKVEDYLTHLQAEGLFIHSAYIFGSRVRGRTDRWSDIDVCVVSPDFGPRNDGITYLWRALRKQDTQAGIEPIGFHPNEFRDDVPVVHEILRRGIRII